MRRLATLPACLVLIVSGGCRERAGDAGSFHPTFNKDVAPIVWRQCSGCHRPGEIGPFSLLTYDDVRTQGLKIVSVTKSRIMPPWLPDSDLVAFANQRRLSESEVALIEQWFSEGAPEGSPADRQPAPEWADGWQLGQPDLIVQAPEAYTIAPGESDVFRNLVMPIPIDRSRYVRGMEVRPGNNKVVHHATIGVDRTRGSRRLDAASPLPGFEGGMFSEGTTSPDNHALGWTPGMAPALEPADMAWRLDQGSDLVVQLHLLPSRVGRTETVQPSVGFFFTDTPPSRPSIDFKLGSKTIDIPAGQADYVAEDRYRLPVDVDVISIYPHAHYLGKEMKAFATLPDGQMKWLLSIPQWDFHWQDRYRYATPVFLPAGTVVTMRYTYDNSDANEDNPSDPPRRVVYGPASSDEMGDLWLRLVARSPADTNVLARGFIDNERRKDILGAEQRVARNPQDAGAHSALGAYYVREGRLQEGILQLEHALRLDRSNVEAHNNLGQAFQRQGKAREATAQFREAARLGPAHDVVRLNLANALQDEGAVEESMREYREALRLNPDSAEAHNDFGTALAASGRLEEAATHFASAIDLRPNYADAQRNLDQVRRLLAASP